MEYRFSKNHVLLLEKEVARLTRELQKMKVLVTEKNREIGRLTITINDLKAKLKHPEA